MDQSIIYNSENENTYLYDNLFRLSMLIHPEIREARDKGLNADIDPYYMKKYVYLKNNGFFSKSKINSLETKINEQKIKESIIQTPQILFEVTDSCNLSCTYCALGDLYEWGENRNSKNINMESAISLLKYIFNLKLRHNQHELTISFYGGEPLLNINFLRQIITTAKKLNKENQIDIKYSMTTNAVLINKYIDFLVENKFNILISLDGDEKNNSYRILRKNHENSFKTIIENIDFIQKNFPEYFDKYINFNAVLHNRNSVKSVYEFIYNKYKKIPQISQLNNIDVDPNRIEIFKKMFNNVRESENEYSKECNNLIPHNKQVSFHELSNFLKYFTLNSYISDINLLMRKNEKYLPASTCIPFSKKIFLTVNGSILPCEKINYKHSLGNVENNVNINISQIAQQYSSYYELLKNKCQHCYIYRFCGTCLFHIINIDNLNKSKCNYFHDKKVFENKLKRIFTFLEKHPNDLFEILENEIIVS